jgi:hypothetical protein
MNDFDPDLDYEPDLEAEIRPQIDPEVYRHYVDVRRSAQHYQLALVAGTMAAGAGVAAWVGVSVMTNAEAEWMAIGLGILTGVVVRMGGKGFDRVFGVLGALLTAIGCFAAIVLAGCHFVAIKSEGVTLMEAFGALTPEMFREIFAATFDRIDAAFYGVALLAAFRISYRRMNSVERATLLAHSEGGGFDSHAQAA